MTNDAIIYTHGSPLDAAERWVELVGRARQLEREKFKTWLTLVGDGDDNVRCFKGEQILKMMRGEIIHGL